MNTQDLSRLFSDRAAAVDTSRPDRVEEVFGRIRRTRRQRAVAAAAASVVVVGVLAAGGIALSATTDRTPEPADRTPTPAPTRKADVPTGQITLTPEIGAGDIRGWELRGSRTNAQPDFAGATDLSLTVQTGELTSFQSHVVSFCHGDPDTWWVLTVDLGGVDGARNPDGSMQDGSRALFGQCSQDDPTEVPGPTDDILPFRNTYHARPRAYPLRMFVTSTLSPAAQRCLSRTADVGACLSAHSLTPLGETDATFGLGVYEHKAAPAVLTGPGFESQALVMARGIEYLVDRAVVAAPGASRLVVQLPASDRTTIVALFHGETAALEQCASRIPIEVVGPKSDRAHAEAFGRRCVPELELRVDGERPRQRLDFVFAEQQALLPPGGAREVTVEVVKNSPRNVRYALVVWEEVP